MTAADRRNGVQEGRDRPLNFEISHLEIVVDDMAVMERFYTEALGFIVTDRSDSGPMKMVFLSHSPDEHHQIVLADKGGGVARDGALDHFAFRVESLDILKSLNRSLAAAGADDLQTVSHGTP